MRTEDRIKSQVEEMLREAEIVRPPVDLLVLAAKRGIEVDFETSESMGELLGNVRMTATGPKMRVNSDLPSRQRFTIAHEIAHTILSPTMGGNRSGLRESATHQRTENLCDKMASEILMPTKWFNAASDRRPVSIEEITRLASVFETSIQSTAVKLVTKYPTYVELICWDVGHDVLSLRWRGGAPKLVKRDERRTLPITSDAGPVISLYEKGSVFSRELTKDGAPFEVESRAFSSDSFTYVLSLVKPFVSEKAISAANAVARARAKRQ